MQQFASELAAHTAQLDMSRWPAPIVRLYLGQATLDEVLAAAAGGKAEQGPSKSALSTFSAASGCCVPARKTKQRASSDSQSKTAITSGLSGRMQ
ncbi:MAG: hypothetical protein JO267_06595 [Alphaproteobacteria bacterium]|nr:hypothetical protein [Alphaproteobacteria bacterium]